MPRPTQRALARRALPADTTAPDATAPDTTAPRPASRPGRTVVGRGIAAMAIGVLGVGVAGSIALTGNAQLAFRPQTTSSPSPQVEISADPTVAAPDAFSRDVDDRVTRSFERPALPAVSARAADLKASSKAIKRADAALEKKKAAEKKREAERLGTPTLPIDGGYTVAARFGAVGSWSRYHTGFDFSTAIGTPVHAPTAGVVTTAGSGSASGWAGTYITVRHADGTQTLYAHLSSVSVAVGDQVKGGDVIGRVGMTGRSFGPHLHFEVYPAGIEPGDIYSAVDPEPWLAKLGLTA